MNAVKGIFCLKFQDVTVNQFMKASEITYTHQDFYLAVPEINRIGLKVTYTGGEKTF